MALVGFINNTFNGNGGGSFDKLSSLEWLMNQNLVFLENWICILTLDGNLLLNLMVIFFKQV
jgi:hypothetical protein